MKQESIKIFIKKSETTPNFIQNLKATIKKTMQNITKKINHLLQILGDSWANTDNYFNYPPLS